MNMKIMYKNLEEIMNATAMRKEDNAMMESAGT